MLKVSKRKQGVRDMRLETLTAVVLVFFAAFVFYEVGATVSQDIDQLKSKIELRR